MERIIHRKYVQIACVIYDKCVESNYGFMFHVFSLKYFALEHTCEKKHP